MAPKKTDTKAVNKKVAPAPPAPKEVEVTQAMIDAHPEWEGAVAVGDIVDAAELTQEDLTSGVEPVAPAKSASKAGGKGYAILRNGNEFIRIYDDKELAEGFIGKDPARSIVSPSSIKSLVVIYDKMDLKTKTKSTQNENFSVEDWEEAMDKTHATKGTCVAKF